jgi:teichuronic acid biosynthesis glycosyltransferase TuaG
MSKPLVSVIMPAYNAQQYIAESIQSVQAQSYTNWELIIVDDNSSDGTAAIINQFVQTDARIKYLFQDRGKQGKARNMAIKNSRGTYIAFLDADDLWDKSKLEIQVNIIETRPDIILVFSEGSMLLPDGTTTKMDVKVQQWSWQKDRDLFIIKNQIPILSVLVKKQALIAVNCFSEDLAIQNVEDYHLWIRLLKTGNFLSVEQPLFYYRIHEQQTTYQGSNITMAIASSFIDLALTDIIESNNKLLRDRLKWIIFQIPDFGGYLKTLKIIFKEKAAVLSVLMLLNKVPNKTLIKKLTFHWL